MITAIDKNTALVLIDLQKGVAQMLPVPIVSDVVKKAVLLIDAFRKVSLPVVVVNVNPTGGAMLKSRKDVTRNMSELPADFTDIADEIKIQPADIRITKRTWNAFFNTSLHEDLQKLKVTGIVLAGVSTSIGVEGTARAASELGYNITFATDAMTDMKADAHENSIRNIFPRVGEVGTTADVIEKLSAIK